MSNADVTSTSEVTLVAPAPTVTATGTTADAVPFADVVETLQGDAHEAVSGAVAYLEAAGETAKSRSDVVVKEVTDDAEKLAFVVADKHGFSAYLTMFKSSIDDGVAKVEAGISDQVHGLIEKGIAALKALKLS